MPLTSDSTRQIKKALTEQNLQMTIQKVASKANAIFGSSDPSGNVTRRPSILANVLGLIKAQKSAGKPIDLSNINLQSEPIEEETNEEIAGH